MKGSEYSRNNPFRQVIAKRFLSLCVGVCCSLSILSAQSEPKVETLWIDGYSSSQASEASHFILEGAGSVNARVFALAEAVDSIATAKAMRSITLNISRFNGLEWEFVASIDLDMAEYSYVSDYMLGMRMGELEIELGAGSYLAQYEVPDSLAVATTLQIEFTSISESASPRLINASVLGYVGGTRLKREIGVTLSGEGEREMLVRNVGPTLENYGLRAVASNPALMVMQDGLKLASNDDWWKGISITEDQMQSAMQLMGAFQLDDKSSDSALSIDSEAGSYQVISRAESNKGGYEIVEIYLN